MDTKGVVKSFLLSFYRLLPFSHEMYSISFLFRLLNWPTLHAKRLPHHHHYRHFIFIRFGHICLCFARGPLGLCNSYHQHGSFQSPRCCPEVSARRDLPLPTGNSEMKVQWTLVTACVCKSSCGARTKSGHTWVYVAVTLST